jgi:cell division protein FtsB
MDPAQDQRASAAQDRRPRVRHRLRTPQEARAWRRRVTGYVLFAAAFVLMVNALVGENGYLATLEARSQQAKLMDQLARMRLKNQQMRDQIQNLRTDPRALEEAARRELNMIKPGETMVVIKDAATPQTPEPKK